MSTVYVHAACLTGDPSLNECLSAKEEERAAAFKFSIDRERYRECHGRLRHDLSAYTGIAAEALVFRFGPFEKPEIVDQPWHFNLSHSGDLYAAAFCQDHAIGVDVETGGDQSDLMDLVTHVCHPDEQDRLAQASKENQRRLFLCHWTGKEAYLKAIGCGFQQPPETVCLSDDPFSGHSDIDAPVPGVDASRWKLHFLEISDAQVLAVAAPREHAVVLVESPFDP